MVIVQLQDGSKAEFAKTPTPQEVDFAFQSKQKQQQQAPDTGIVGKTKAVLGGIAEGVGGVALTAEDYLARKIVDSLPDNFTFNGLTKKQMQDNLANSPKLQEQLKQLMGGNDNPASYEVGKVGGEIASLATPVGAVGKATKLGAEALGAGKVISKVAQAGAEGAAFTAGQGLTEGQNQSLSDYAINAGLNMALPIGGAIAKKIGESAPARVINSLIKPLAKDFAYGHNAGRTVAELGITANNFEDLISNIKIAKDKVGSDLGAVASTINTAGVVSPEILKPIDEAIANANKTPRTNEALINRLEATKQDLLDNINKNPNPFQIKSLIGDLTKWTGSASDDKTINKALKSTYGTLNSKIDASAMSSLSPEDYAKFKKLNSQYGDLISAQNAATYRDKIVERQNLISFGAQNAGLITALTTAIATGGASIPTILAGLSGVAIDKAMATPAFKTRLASLLTKLSPNEVSTFFEKVPVAKEIVNENDIKNLAERVKNTPNKQGGFVDIGTMAGDSTKKTNPAMGEIAGIPKDLQPLAEEARKYKNAEEFVKAKQTIPEYGMTHRPSEGPRAFDLTELVDGEQMIPKDMYKNWYGSRGSAEDMESINALKKIKGNPEANVTIYRASPKAELNNGDWVTFSKKYAQMSAREEGTSIHSFNVKAKDIKWAMDDINEFGYYPSKETLTDLYNKAVGKK